MIIVNAFSANMLPPEGGVVRFTPVSREHASAISVSAESAVGHADTAAVFSNELGRLVECNRTSVTVERGTPLLLGQYSGPRLLEGATQLPQGATIRWMVVTLD